MLPTEGKVKEVEQLRSLIEGCTVAVAADYSGMTVDAMTELRRALRQRDVTFRVVKNRLAYLAADAAGRPLVKEIVKGPTGIAFGYEDPVEPAKALTEFIRSTRSPMKIGGAVLGDRSLSPEEVGALAALPPREELVGRLLGQLQSPINSLAYVLVAPVSALARVLQRRIEAMGGEDSAQDAAPASASTEPEDGETPAATEE